MVAGGSTWRGPEVAGDEGGAAHLHGRTAMVSLLSRTRERDESEGTGGRRKGSQGGAHLRRRGSSRGWGAAGGSRWRGRVEGEVAGSDWCGGEHEEGMEWVRAKGIPRWEMSAAAAGTNFLDFRVWFKRARGLLYKERGEV